jgi:hypothetical protein
MPSYRADTGEANPANIAKTGHFRSACGADAITA